MPKKICGVLLGVGIIMAIVAISYADNIVLDPGFELSLANGTFPSSGSWKPSWALSTAGAVCTTTSRYSGNNGLWEYTGAEAGAYWSGPYQEFAAQAGDTASASGWGKTPSGQPWQTNSFASIRIQFLDSSHSLIIQYDSNKLTAANSGWARLTVVTPAAPAGTKYVRFVFYLEKPQVAGQSVVNFDDASLTIVPSAVPKLSVSVGALGFSENKTSSSFTITNTGSGELRWSIAKDAAWLTISSSSGTTTTGTDSITVVANYTGLAEGNYKATLTITSDGGTKAISVYLITPRSYTVPNLPSSVRLSGAVLYLKRRLPDGSLAPEQPFIIKGVAWSPASIGTLNDQFARQLEFSRWSDLDIAMIKDLNANTVYTFLDFGTDAAAVSLLDMLYKNDLYAIITVDWDGTNDTNRLQTVVNAYKNHPAVLMWAIGNEWNINLYHSKFTSLDQAAAATQAAAQLIKSLNTTHPVTSILGEIEILPDQPLSKTALIVNSICSAVDVWGLNIYRGPSFGSLFSQWSSITTKPMFLSEFGADSYFSTSWYPVVGRADETSQKNYLISQWQEIVPQLSAKDISKPCLGGTVFEFGDEWWKVRSADGGSPTVHDNGGFPTTWNPFSQPDGFANEEFFGIVGIDRTPKEAFAALSQAFNSTTSSISASTPGNSNGRGCFIATAAYGSYLHPFVKILREFRDKLLLSSSTGRSFVEWYYHISPSVADFISKYSMLSFALRILLLPIIGFAFLCIKVGVLPALSLCLGFVFMLGLQVKEKSKKRIIG